jgi:hypothetical protein
VNARLYVVLESHWDTSETTAISIYAYDRGYGGGVWYSDDSGGNWSPTTHADWSDGLFLEDGFHANGRIFPKNVRRLALDPASGDVLLALTWGNLGNEGVWRGRWTESDVFWERMTATAGGVVNVPADGGGALDAIDGLWVDGATGDVVFSTERGAWRCPGGGCRAGDPGAAAWIPLHARSTAQGADSNGLDALTIHDADVHVGAPTLRFLATEERGLVFSADGRDWSNARGPAPLFAPDGPRPCRALWISPSGSASFALYSSGSEGGGQPVAVELWFADGLPGLQLPWLRHEIDPLAPVHVNQLAFIDDRQLWVAADEGPYFASRDAAGTWTFTRSREGLEGSTVRATALATSSAGADTRVLLALEGKGVFLRTSLDPVWRVTHTNPGLRRSLAQVVDFAWSRSNADRVYAVAATSGMDPASVVLRSDDAGASWIQVSKGVAHGHGSDLLPIELERVTGLDGREQLWLAVARHPGGAQNGPAAGLYSSSDGGLSWLDVTEGLPSTPPAFLRADAATPGTLILGSTGRGAVRRTGF